MLSAMTNPNLAYVQLIIDRSGSMHPLRQTVVSGLNDFLAGQRKLAGVCNVGLCWFGDSIDVPFDNQPLTDVKDLVLDDYQPNGGTPLYEAMCKSIDALGKRLAGLSESQRPALITVLTITDGDENQSGPGFTADAVKCRVEEQSKTYKWNFQYLGANQDVVLTAKKLGLGLANVASFSASAGHTQAAYSVLNASVTRGRNAVLRGASADAVSASMSYSAAEKDSLVDDQGVETP